MDDKAAVMLGFAAKAGALVYGAGAARRAIQGGQARLVMLAADASANTLKRIGGACACYGVRCVRYDADLGRAVGKEACKVLAVKDSRFAQSISNLYGE